MEDKKDKTKNKKKNIREEIVKRINQIDDEKFLKVVLSVVKNYKNK